MGRKLTLDVDGLRVESYETGDVEAGRGTIHARDHIAAGGVTNTNCFTTPCCPQTVTCLD
jgi:hypothetical protein